MKLFFLIGLLIRNMFKLYAVKIVLQFFPWCSYCYSYNSNCKNKTQNYYDYIRDVECPVGKLNN